jgi:hypothetical protein
MTRRQFALTISGGVVGALEAFVLVTLWDWYAVPYGARPVSFAQVVIALLCIDLIKRRDIPSENIPESWDLLAERLGRAVAAIPIAWAFRMVLP